MPQTGRIAGLPSQETMIVKTRRNMCTMELLAGRSCSRLSLGMTAQQTAGFTRNDRSNSLAGEWKS